MGKATGTVWDNIAGTAKNMSGTEIPATFQIKLGEGISYTNPTTGSNVLCTNANATEHMGEYVSRFGTESEIIDIRSQEMLESYSASLNETMKDLATKTPGRYFETYGNWELGINTETDFKVSYTRNIESMGKGLVLFKVKADEKAIGQNFHYFYGDSKKPPLDIAINPKNKMIEYVSSFAQDEKIEKEDLKIKLELINKNVEFDCLDMDEEHPEKRFIRDFNMNFNNNSLYLIDTNYIEKLTGYEINSNNYILFDKENVFHGLLLSNISVEEVERMKESLVL